MAVEKRANKVGASGWIRELRDRPPSVHGGVRGGDIGEQGGAFRRIELRAGGHVIDDATPFRRAVFPHGIGGMTRRAGAGKNFPPGVERRLGRTVACSHQHRRDRRRDTDGLTSAKAGYSRQDE